MSLNVLLPMSTTHIVPVSTPASGSDSVCPGDAPEHTKTDSVQTAHFVNGILQSIWRDAFVPRAKRRPGSRSEHELEARHCGQRDPDDDRDGDSHYNCAPSTAPAGSVPASAAAA